MPRTDFGTARRLDIPDRALSSGLFCSLRQNSWRRCCAGEERWALLDASAGARGSFWVLTAPLVAFRYLGIVPRS
jgi:hypothetical protein